MSPRSVLMCVVVVAGQIACSDRYEAGAIEQSVADRSINRVADKDDRPVSKRKPEPLMGDIDTSQRSELANSLIFAPHGRLFSAAPTDSRADDISVASDEKQAASLVRVQP